MIFPDNKRIFMGDFVRERAPSLDDCDRSQLLNVAYPEECAAATISGIAAPK